MRENNRNSIEKCRKKLPQFTTMNVIDGQAGLISYFSLIFYSLTIYNILNIIVLLILAGVAIATLLGPNGILKNATDAKQKTETAYKEEQKKLAQLEANTNLEKYEYEDSNGNKIVIPAGCTVSDIESENTLEDGLVIIDKNGNEWVWIEVPKEITAEANTSEEIFEVLNNYAIDYRLTYNTDVWYDGCGLTEDEYNAKKEDML